MFSQGGFQVDETDAMDVHVVEYSVASGCATLEVSESRDLGAVQGNDCLVVVTSFDSSMLLYEPHRSNLRLRAQTQGYQKRHCAQRECAFPDEQQNPWPLPLSKGESNKKLLTLKLESEAGFMR